MSAEAMAKTPVNPGGGFLVSPIPRGGILTREKFSDDQKLFAETASKFWKEEVLTKIEAIEHKEYVEENGVKVPLSVSLLRKCAELGLLALEVAEEYGGMGYDKTTSSIVAESMGGCASQAATFGAHSGIGMLPIVFFGTPEQKARYLPKLCTAEWVSCYALTEPGSGSDALSGKAVAVPVDGGAAYEITGEKQYITNGSWAHIAIVFASVEGQYSAFIVDLSSKGVTRGPEEKKMGIRGSSTCSLTFENVRVPKEEMLGKIGDAANIALNILYLGRMKLGFGALATSKYTIDTTLKFAKDRKQFGQPVIAFEMQKAKLADMVCQTYALDSLAFRTTGDIDTLCATLDKHDPAYDEKVIKILRSFGVETSIIKVLGSETLMRIANHAVRMHGGYGFCEEYQVERVARDNVVDTIFEGTNDINRLVVFGTLVQNIFGGELPFREYMEALRAEMRAGKWASPVEAGPLGREFQRVNDAKRALAYTVESAIIGIGKDVRVEQQVIATMADALMGLYAAESTLARVHDLLGSEGAGRKSVLAAVAQAVVHEKCEEIRRCTLDTLAHVVPAAELPAKRQNLLKLLESTDAPVDLMGLRRIIADYTIEAGHYCF